MGSIAVALSVGLRPRHSWLVPASALKPRSWRTLWRRWWAAGTRVWRVRSRLSGTRWAAWSRKQHIPQKARLRRKMGRQCRGAGLPWARHGHHDEGGRTPRKRGPSRRARRHVLFLQVHSSWGCLDGALARLVPSWEAPSDAGGDESGWHVADGCPPLSCQSTGPAAVSADWARLRAPTATISSVMLRIWPSMKIGIGWALEAARRRTRPSAS